MEKLQGPINACLVAEDLEVGWLDEFINNSANLNFEDPCNTNEDGNFYEQDYNFPNLENKVPFLQVLQSSGPSYHPFQLEHEQKAASFPALMQLEPNFQLLFRLQHQKLASYYNTIPSDVTNDLTDNNKKSQLDIVPSKWGLEKVDGTHAEPYLCNNNIDFQHLHSPEVKSESEVIHQEVFATVVVENVDKPLGNICNNNGDFSNEFDDDEYEKVLLKTASSNSNQKEKKKRKRTSTRTAKNKQEIESQRMTHIAVERNRRRQMNEHLNALRSLMPSSYVQKGDQSSIIGGAIDFVKELEQMLQSLEAQKRLKHYEENGDVSISSSSTSNSHLSNFFTPFQASFHSLEQGNGNATTSGNENENREKKMYVMRNNNEELSAIQRSSLAEIEVVVIQNHVNLKIQCQRRPSQLFNVIVAFEELRLTVLHLNITSLDITLVHYSFNLKIEDDCKLSTADDVARAVHQIFSLINIS